MSAARGKRYTEARGKVDRNKRYDLEEGIKLLKEVLIPVLNPEYQKNLSYYLSLARERKISLMRELELQEKFIDAIFEGIVRR